MDIKKEFFGKTKDGRDAFLFTLSNDKGMNVTISNYGGVIQKLRVPQANGSLVDVALGFDNIEAYIAQGPYFGCIVGRYANRIAQGKFSIDGIEYNLSLNRPGLHLHGGVEGFGQKLWTASTEKKTNMVYLNLAYESPHMEEGYPGNLLTEVRYSLNNKNELGMNFRAVTDKPTVINLTNHSYFNLSGVRSNVLEHWLKIDCDHYTVNNSDNIPTGKIEPVEGTPLDFRHPKPIGRDFHLLPNGYDHNYVIGQKPGKLKWFARAESLLTGICMEVATTQPGVQLYTANFLKDVKGKNEILYQAQDGFCLETQHFANSPNTPSFPSTVLRPGEKYDHHAIYRFSHKD
jgi:aldose 1-epimerase